MNVLILGSSEDTHAAHLYQALFSAGVAVEYLDTLLFPTQIALSWQPKSGEGYLSLPARKKINFRDIHSIFWRNFSGVALASLPDPYQERIAFNDCMSVLRILFKSCPARWVNSWEAYELHKEKPLQLRLAHQLGVKIPTTLITNDPYQVIEFAQTQKQAIFKPVYGGAHAQFITSEHLESKRLQAVLNISPVTLQEYIPGTNIRTYVIADAIYAAEIRSNSLDFREDATAQLLPVKLPKTIQQQCLDIAKAFLLHWTAIDWRLTPSGEYVFLEANPSPMFLHFETITKFPITEALVKLLTR